MTRMEKAWEACELQIAPGSHWCKCSVRTLDLDKTNAELQTQTHEPEWALC